MIRINLLGRPRPKVKKKIEIAGTLQLALFLIVLAAAIGVLIGHQVLISREITVVDEEIAKQKREILRLNQLKQKVTEFEALLNRLQTRLNVIEELRRGQQGPVQLLDTLGNTVSRTDTLWLTRMDQKGTKITFEGMAGSVNAVANFMTNLKNSGFFTNIEIKEAVQSTTEGVENYKFSLSADFALPKAAQPAAPPVAAGGRT